MVSKRTRITILLLTGWIAISFISYYFVQGVLTAQIIHLLGANKGIFVTNIPSLTGILLWGRALLVGIWCLSVSLGVGLKLLGWLKLSRDGWSAAILATGLGVGVLGILLFGMALIGAISARPLFLFFLLLLSAVRQELIAWLKSASWRLPTGKVRYLVAAVLFFSLTSALLPPTSWDGLFYHLTGPKLYIAAGRIVSGIDIPHLSFPTLFESWFLAQMQLGGDILPRLWHWLFLPLSMGLIYLVGKELFQLSENGSWASVLFFLTMPMGYLLASQAYNDLPLGFYQLGAVYGLIKWKKAEEETGWFYLAALFVGFAMGLKYTSFVTPTVLALFLLYDGRQQFGEAIKRTAVFSLIALAIASPWYIRNAAFTGNPVYPFVFAGPNWDSFRAEAYAESGTGIGYPKSSCQNEPDILRGQHATGCSFSAGYLVASLIGLPLTTTMGIFDASKDGFMGPIFLIFLPLLFIYRWREKEKFVGERLFLILAGAQLSFWIFGVIFSAALWQSRLLLPTLILLSPILGLIYDEMEGWGWPNFRPLIGYLLWVVLGINLLLQFIAWVPQQPWAFIMGMESREESLSRRLGTHYEAMEAINQLPQEAKILFLWEPRSYYCDRACQPDSIIDQLGHLHYLHGDGAGIIEALHADRYTHILLHRAGLDFVREAAKPSPEAFGCPETMDCVPPLPDPVVWQEMVEDYLILEQLIGEDGYELYRIK